MSSSRRKRARQLSKTLEDAEEINLASPCPKIQHIEPLVEILPPKDMLSPNSPPPWQQKKQVSVGVELLDNHSSSSSTLLLGRNDADSYVSSTTPLLTPEGVVSSSSPEIQNMEPLLQILPPKGVISPKSPPPWQRRKQVPASVKLVDNHLSPASFELEDNHSSPDSIALLDREDADSYISSTTTLWNFAANPELDYTCPSPSDVTGSDDYSIVYARRCQKEIENKEKKKHEMLQLKINEKKFRDKHFKEFSIDNITWSEFRKDYIRFSMKPKDFYPQNFSSKQKYTFSMAFNYDFKYWGIRTFRVPGKHQIMKNYLKNKVTDEKVQAFFEFVVNVIFRNMEWEKVFKEEREADYRAGVDMELNDSELEVFLSHEERNEYIERRERICRRMMSPSPTL